jgi:hypothetical protein
VSHLRSYAVFKADLPDDAQWNENEDLIRPGGLNVMVAICDDLRKNGVIATPPQQHKFYGWSFEMKMDGVAIWCMVQGYQGWLLITEVRRGILGWFRIRSRLRHERAIQLITTAIQSDPHFTGLTWMTRREFEVSAEADKTVWG